MRARLHAWRARRARRRRAAGPPPPISTPAGRNAVPDLSRPPVSASAAGATRRAGQRNLRRQRAGLQRRRPAPARESPPTGASVDPSRARSVTDDVAEAAVDHDAPVAFRREYDVRLRTCRLPTSRSPTNVSDAPEPSSEIVTTGVRPVSGSTPCCLTKIVGLHVPPADVPSGRGSNPTDAQPPAEGRSRHDTSDARAQRRARVDDAWTPPSSIACRGYTAGAGKGPSGYRPFGMAIASTFGGGPVPRFHVRCHQTKNAAERMIASARDVHVQANAAELVRRVDAQHLDPEAADAVEEDVEGEQAPGRIVPEPALDEEEHPGGSEVPQRLVQERRVERLVVDVVDRAVLGIDLEAPRQVGRPAEQLLVPPVPEAADALRDEQRRRRRSRRAPRRSRRSASRRSRRRPLRARCRPRRRARPSRSRTVPTTRPAARPSS